MTDSAFAARPRPGVDRPAGSFAAATSNGAIPHPAPRRTATGRAWLRNAMAGWLYSPLRPRW
jgi:hypothetical protein